jgi:hypothetical protein
MLSDNESNSMEDYSSICNEEISNPTTSNQNQCSKPNNSHRVSNKTTAATAKKMKPVVIDVENHDFLATRSKINQIKFSKTVLLKKGINKLQVITQNHEDKKKLLEFLKPEETQERIYFFHTFTEKEDKNQIYVLKNHYYINCKELLDKLEAAGLPVKDVTFLNKSLSNPSFLIHFDKDSINLQTLSRKHNIIDCLLVKWEKFDFKKKRISQCRNCQQFGHAARNCGKKYRCVKCVDTHLPGQCKKTTRDTDPKCVNCNQNHAANSKVCPAYTEYVRKISSLKKNTPHPRKFNSTPAPWSTNLMNSSNFPNISQNINSHNKLSQNNSLVSDSNNVNESSFSNYSNLTNEFNNIPNINTTLNLYKELITKLKSTQDHKARISFMIEYTLG